MFQAVQAAFMAFDGGGEAFHYAKQFVQAGVGFSAEFLQPAFAVLVQVTEQFEALG